MVTLKYSLEPQAAAAGAACRPETVMPRMPPGNWHAGLYALATSEIVPKMKLLDRTVGYTACTAKARGRVLGLLRPAFKL